jgi:hypothetical protein
VSTGGRGQGFEDLRELGEAVKIRQLSLPSRPNSPSESEEGLTPSQVDLNKEWKVSRPLPIGFSSIIFDRSAMAVIPLLM